MTVSSFKTDSFFGLLSVILAAVLSGCASLEQPGGNLTAESLLDWHCRDNQQGGWDCYDRASGALRTSKHAAVPESKHAVVPESIHTVVAESKHAAVAESKHAVVPESKDTAMPTTIPAPHRAEPVTDLAASREAAPEPAASVNSLLAYPADYYAVQLLAVEKETSITQYLQRNASIQGQTVAVHYAGKAVDLLILGVYPSKTAARLAIAQLPAQPHPEPWIRPLGPLQSLLRAETGR